MTEANIPVVSESEFIVQNSIDITAQKRAINRILNELDVKKIIYIDDRCSINDLKESFIGKMKALYHTKPESLNFVDWEQPSMIFEKAINVLWENADDPTRKDFYISLLKYEDQKGELANSFAPLNMKEVLKERIDIYSPTQWEENKDSIIRKIGDRYKVLFLFDIEFNYSPLPDGRNGLNLVQPLLSNNDISDYIYCGVFSHLFDVSEEYERRTKYSLSYSLKKNRFYTISKKRFSDTNILTGLAEGIKNALVINEIDVLKNETTRIIKYSYQKSIKEIADLQPDTFNHIILRSSRTEGIWEMATLIRLSNLISINCALKTLLPSRRRKIINANLEKIRTVEKINTGAHTDIDRTQIKKLRKREIYVDGKILNELHFPISNGDIFLIGEKEYILLVQPCNIELRSCGRRNGDYDIGFILEIQKMSVEEYDQSQKNKLVALGKIEDENPESKDFKFVQFSKFQAVSLSPIDLIVYNSDGHSKINLNMQTIENKEIQDSWKKRYKALYSDFSKYKDCISAFRKSRSMSKTDLLDMVYNGYLFKGYTINNENALYKSTLTFDIKRVSNYKAPFSSDLLQKFMLYMSRNAFDHDFAKVDKD
jgi:hypothetical protein